MERPDEAIDFEGLWLAPGDLPDETIEAFGGGVRVRRRVWIVFDPDHADGECVAYDASFAEAQLIAHNYALEKRLRAQ